MLPVLLQSNTLIAPGVGDQFLWDLLTSEEDLISVTGAKLLLQAEPLQARITVPMAFTAQVLV